jgi:hypothetical protein
MFERKMTKTHILKRTVEDSFYILLQLVHFYFLFFRENWQKLIFYYNKKYITNIYQIKFHKNEQFYFYNLFY